jgi:hypothetical protein
VDKEALRKVSSEYFGFPCQFSFQRLLHTRNLSSGAGTIGQLVDDLTNGLSLTPHQDTKKKKKLTVCGNMGGSFTGYKTSGTDTTLWLICYYIRTISTEYGRPKSFRISRSVLVSWSRLPTGRRIDQFANLLSGYFSLRLLTASVAFLLHSLSSRSISTFLIDRYITCFPKLRLL